MSIWLGGVAGMLRLPRWPGVTGPPWRLYLGLNDVLDPGPSRTLLFWDERADVINFGNFFIDMSGFPNQPNLTQFGGDVPASYHNGAGGVSFVDGHAEIRRWRDTRTVSPQAPKWMFGPIPSPNNPDIEWLQERATRRMQ